MNPHIKFVANRNFGELSAHVLAALPQVQVRRVTTAYPDTPSGLGMALRDVLANAVDALKPNQHTQPQPDDRRWRLHLILKWCYFEAVSRDDIATRLFIDRGTYNHEQARAIDALAEKLAELSAAPVQAEPFITHTQPLPRSLPRRLPPMLTHALIGRVRELEVIVELLVQGKSVALHGLPGVGKPQCWLPLPTMRACRRILWMGCCGRCWAQRAAHKLC